MFLGVHLPIASMGLNLCLAQQRMQMTTLKGQLNSRKYYNMEINYVDRVATLQSVQFNFVYSEYKSMFTNQQFFLKTTF